MIALTFIYKSISSYLYNITRFYMDTRNYIYNIQATLLRTKPAEIYSYFIISRLHVIPMHQLVLSYMNNH